MADVKNILRGMIGIFDSGAGGLTVYGELLKALPAESYIYVADGAHCPYGPKPKEYIMERSRRIASFLIGKGAEVIVVACNTATAAAIETLRQEFDIPIVGMEPAVKPASLSTKSGVIGVLATRGTFKGELYLNTAEKFAHSKQIKLIEVIGTGLVEAVERGALNTPETQQLVESYILPMLKEDADCIVLGCTHYPFLEGAIRAAVASYANNPNDIQIINPAPAVAKRVKSILEELHIPKKGAVAAQNRADELNYLNTKSNNLILTTSSDTRVLRELATIVTSDAAAALKEKGADGITIGSENYISLAL